MWRQWLEQLEGHRYRILGGLGGLVFALLVIRFGLLWALFIALCTGLGYWLGKHLDENPERFAELLERLLPPGSGR
ncbi:MAG: DUF2273 domain-containing protein [Firmicutes bacterium]|nr:DUF2273 domain-containing protein [Bacillota bacterium]